MADDSPRSPLDASDPYARQEQTFPVLPAEMVARMRPFGAEDTIPDGGMLFERGQRSVDFFVILDGTVDILEYDDHGLEKSVHAHRANQFTGELDLFNDRQILVSGRAIGDTRVLRIGRPDFARLIAAESDIGEVIMRAFILRRVALMQHGQGGVALVGPENAADTTRLQTFLGRNGYPYRLIDTDSDSDAAGFLECFELTEAMLPVVVFDGEPLRNPSNAALADALGLTFEVDPARVHDLAVVGAGPAGLAAAVYAASEGLDTIVIESVAPGGQAGTSSKIENYLGFPTGISGQALAGRAQVQAQKFGARLAVSRAVAAIEHGDGAFRLQLEDNTTVSARAVVIATGARYQRLDVEDYERFEGQGIHYAATAMEASLCRDKPVIVVGGGNSAGQAAVYLSRHASHVHMLCRSGGLAATMSNYLVERIEASEHITLHARTEIAKFYGEDTLSAVDWRHRDSGDVEHVEIAAIFVMIGAAPCTDWLNGCVELDEKGFVVTGKGMSPYETTHEGLFAVGDVRSGSVKRVASGVGEGSVVVQRIHQFLEDAS